MDSTLHRHVNWLLMVSILLKVRVSIFLRAHVGFHHTTPSELSQRLCHLTCNIIVFMLFFGVISIVFMFIFAKHGKELLIITSFYFFVAKGHHLFIFGKCQKLCLSKWLFVSFILSLFFFLIFFSFLVK